MNGDERLRQVFLAAGEGLPGEPLEWNTTIDAARRSRLVHLVAAWAVAAAVVIGAAAGAVALRDDASPGPIPPAGTPSPSPSPEPTSPEAAPEPSPEEEGVRVDRMIPTARAFLEAASGGDADGMWELMSPRARAGFDEDFAAWQEFAQSGASEGLGAWPAADPSYHVTMLASSGDGAAAVVTISGTREAEGNVEKNQYALPVVVTEGGPEGPTFVEPFLEPNEWSFVSPELGETELVRLPADAELAVDAPERPQEAVISVARADAVRVSKQEGVATVARSPEGGDWWRLSWTPDEPLAPGEYVVTYVGLFENGLSAEAHRFIVE